MTRSPRVLTVLTVLTVPTVLTVSAQAPDGPGRPAHARSGVRWPGDAPRVVGAGPRQPDSRGGTRSRSGHPGGCPAHSAQGHDPSARADRRPFAHPAASLQRDQLERPGAPRAARAAGGSRGEPCPAYPRGGASPPFAIWAPRAPANPMSASRRPSSRASCPGPGCWWSPGPSSRPAPTGPAASIPGGRFPRAPKRRADWRR